MPKLKINDRITYVSTFGTRCKGTIIEFSGDDLILIRQDSNPDSENDLLFFKEELTLIP